MLKSKKSDDPWIARLFEELVKIDTIKELTPDFSNVFAYNLGSPAIVTDEPVKSKRKLIVALKFVLNFIIAVFVTLSVSSRNGVKQDS